MKFTSLEELQAESREVPKKFIVELHSSFVLILELRFLEDGVYIEITLKESGWQNIYLF